MRGGGAGWPGRPRRVSPACPGLVSAADFGDTEHEHAAFDVVVHVARVDEQVLQVVGVVGVDGEDFFPGALVEDELQGVGAGLSGLTGHPGELVVGQLANLDAVVSDRLRYLGHGRILSSGGVPPKQRRTLALPAAGEFSREVRRALPAEPPGRLSYCDELTGERFRGYGI